MLKPRGGKPRSAASLTNELRENPKSPALRARACGQDVTNSPGEQKQRQNNA